MRTYLTTAAVAALAWLPPAIPTAAQEEATMAEALAALERKTPMAERPAFNILRQMSGPRPAAELDAFADRLAAMMADVSLPEHVRSNAKYALSGATWDGYHRGSDRTEPGTPYPRAFDLLVRVYEGGTYDGALHTIILADSVRGLAYVRDVFERSERPPLCRWNYESGRNEPLECVRGFHTFHETPWCRAGRILYRDTVSQARERTPSDRLVRGAGEPAPVPDGLPEHVEDWHRRCARL
ncbi:MAG: hypothetical protein J4F34_04550 [Gemmatimonadetes bacterium]|nr:hypothetical protein [Gemmatimonadota bacterium]